MPIPDYQTVMLPLLKFSADNRDHSIKEAVEVLGKAFSLTSQELDEVLPSGALRFRSKIAWAKAYLKQAGLLESPSRGTFKITKRGQGVLAEKPSRINVKLLMRFPEFVEFTNRTKDRGGAGEVKDAPEELKTPEELIETGYRVLRATLAADLLERVKNCSPKFFESLVIELLLKMGYGGNQTDAGKAIGKSGDGGIDGVIKQDRLGLDVIYVQAKRWEGTVGSKEIRNFVGGLVGRKADKGVFITTSSFSADARTYVETIQHKVILIDGAEVAELMVDHNVGVSESNAYKVKRIDTDYFTEE